MTKAANLTKSTNVVKKPKILLLTTGGTITMVKDSEKGLVPCSQADSLIQRIPEISQLAEMDLLPLANIDSSNVLPSLWLDISEALYERWDDYDGFVVTHGTDTLSYTSAAISFLLQELNKPIVITGSQVPLEEIGSDGRANLINAFRVAISDIAETVVVFGSLIIRGTRAKKTSAFDLQAFTSANVLPLGSIGLSIRYESGKRCRSRRKPLFQPFLNESVAMISVFPGLKPEVLGFLAEKYSGIVLEGYGAGNIPTEGLSLVPVIQASVEKGIPVVVCTQCLFGSTEMELYQVGRVALEAGAIPAMDMTPETTFVKLMWVLGQTHDLKTVESMMRKSFLGELHEGG
ncbi:MAG: asparaginase [Candidatus Riflebacteria bacterium]|nr:asparaginase [Candidatus Riflebacteria bacterium]